MGEAVRIDLFFESLWLNHDCLGRTRGGISFTREEGQHLFGPTVSSDSQLRDQRTPCDLRAKHSSVAREAINSDEELESPELGSQVFSHSGGRVGSEASFPVSDTDGVSRSIVLMHNILRHPGRIYDYTKLYAASVAATISWGHRAKDFDSFFYKDFYSFVDEVSAPGRKRGPFHPGSNLASHLVPTHDRTWSQSTY